MNTPRIYVQLSSEWGYSWTAAQATPTLTTTTATYIVGGIVNMWGRTWVASDFSNTNFRVRVINVAGSTARTFSLDWLAVRVSYQESGPAITSIAVTPVNLTVRRARHNSSRQREPIRITHEGHHQPGNLVFLEYGRGQHQCRRACQHGWCRHDHNIRFAGWNHGYYHSDRSSSTIGLNRYPSEWDGGGALFCNTERNRRNLTL